MPNLVRMALVVARPGPLRNSLQALMTTIPQIEILAETKDVASLLRMGAEIQPNLVLLDAALPVDEVWAAVGQIKAGWSRTRTIVLVEDARQQREAEDAGADVVLFKGFPAAKLRSAIEGLIRQSE